MVRIGREDFIWFAASSSFFPFFLLVCYESQIRYHASLLLQRYTGSKKMSRRNLATLSDLSKGTQLEKRKFHRSWNVLEILLLSISLFTSRYTSPQKSDNYFTIILKSMDKVLLILFFVSYIFATTVHRIVRKSWWWKRK